MAKRSGGGTTIRVRGAAAQRLAELMAASIGEPMRTCRFCGCHDARACPGGCSWTGRNLCSACTPSIPETIASLCLVSGTAHITDDQVGAWSADQRADAYAWAMALHYRASDNDVDVPPRPDFTVPPGEVPHG